MKPLALPFILLYAIIVPVTCAPATMAVYPDATLTERFRLAAGATACAGKALADRLKARSDDVELAQARAAFISEAVIFISVMRELYAGYQSAAVRLSAAVSNLNRADAALARIEGDWAGKIAETRGAARAARLKGFKSGVAELRRRLARQRAVMQSGQADLEARLEALDQARQRFAKIVFFIRKTSFTGHGGLRSKDSAGTDLYKRPGEKAAAARLKKVKAAAKAVKTRPERFVRVSAGQTTLGLAVANRLRLSQLLRLNPALKNNPDRLLANAKVRVR